MNLTELQLKARVRTSWQALDLGVKMACRWYCPLVLAWLLPAFAIYLLLGVLLYTSPLLMLLILWWLKPLLERLPLVLLSRYIFNDQARGVFSWRALLHLYRFDLFSSLTLRRADLQRSFNLPVTVLERQKGRERKRRCQQLRQGSGSAGGWLTLVILHLELLLPLGVALPVFFWVDSYLDVDLIALAIDENLSIMHLQNALIVLSMALMAPFYIAGGFSLYLNRRVELEAWDLELVFRESARRRVSTSKVKPLMLALLMLLMSSLVAPLSIPPAQAQEPGLTTRQSEAREQIRTILETPPFVIEEHVSHWQWGDGSTPDLSDSALIEWLVSLFGGHDADMGLLFKLAELLLWISVGLLVVIILKKLLIHFKGVDVSNVIRQRTGHSPQVMMGMAISAESLPQDIDASIDQAFERGDERQAVSLIYRHVLYLLVHQHQVPVEPWYTELECASAVKQWPSLTLEGRFDELTQHWLRLAYAHQSPPRAQVLSLYQALKQVLVP